MRFRAYRDNTSAWHLDLIGENANPWSVDLVSVCAAIVLVTGFVCALASHF